MAEHNSNSNSIEQTAKLVRRCNSESKISNYGAVLEIKAGKIDEKRISSPEGSFHSNTSIADERQQPKQRELSTFRNGSPCSTIDNRLECNSRKQQFVRRHSTRVSVRSATMDDIIAKAINPPFLFPSVNDLANVEHEEKRRCNNNPNYLEEIASSESVNNKEQLPPLTRKQKLTLVMMAFANFSATVVFSCIAPFFPSEAKLKGASETEIGLIFGIFELNIFLISPIFGRYIMKIGSKFLFAGGLFVTGFTSLLFGLLNQSPDGVTFVVLCFVVRFFEAVGDAAFLTASFAIIANEFPGRISTTIGILETFSGLGFSAGPPIGGALYTIGGFTAPFWVLGVCLIVAGCLSVFLISPQVDQPRHPEVGILRLLSIPSVFLMICGIVVSAMSLSFLDPTLESHLENFELSPFVVGLIFLLTGGIYTLTAPFWGWLVDKKNNARAIVTFGSVLSVIAFLFLGPSPIFHISKQLWIVAVSLLVLGLGIGALYIPPFQSCLQSALAKGYPDNFQTYGLISAIFQSSMSLGAFVGPTVGGILVENLGFNWCSTILAGMHLLLAVANVCFLWYSRRKNRTASNAAVYVNEAFVMNTS